MKTKKKRDFEARLFIELAHLKVDKTKTYSQEECPNNIVYIFDDYDEFKNYFVKNNFDNITNSLLNLCIIRTTKKGTIIAFKGLCDHIIRKHSLIDSSTIEKNFDVKATPCTIEEQRKVRRRKQYIVKK